MLAGSRDSGLGLSADVAGSSSGGGRVDTTVIGDSDRFTVVVDGCDRCSAGTGDALRCHWSSRAAIHLVGKGLLLVMVVVVNMF